MHFFTLQVNLHTIFIVSAMTGGDRQGVRLCCMEYAMGIRPQVCGQISNRSFKARFFISPIRACYLLEPKGSLKNPTSRILLPCSPLKGLICVSFYFPANGFTYFFTVILSSSMSSVCCCWMYFAIFSLFNPTMLT